MEKLISNTDYGNYLNKLNLPDYEYRYRRSKYDEFLIQPLTIGMFVPCKLVNGVWVVVEEPKPENYFDVDKPSDQFNEEDKEGLNSYSSALMYYDDAKKNVLFIGCEIEKRWDNIHITKHGNTVFFSNWPKTSIEQIVKHRIDLTKTAQKQIGL